MESKKRYKYCVVPDCRTTSVRFPEKQFFSLPLQKDKRKKWLCAMGRGFDDLSHKTRGLVCQDHFNLEEDLENFMKFKYYAGGKVQVKEDVVPHLFSCQTDQTAAQPEKEHDSSKNLRKKKTLGQSSRAISTSGDDALEDIDEIVDKEVEEPMEDENIPRSPSPNQLIAAKALCSLSPRDPISLQERKDKSVKKSQLTLETEPTPKQNMDNSATISTTSSSCNPSINTNPTEANSLDSSDSCEFEDTTFKQQLSDLNMRLIMEHPKLYLGIDKTCLNIVEGLAQKTNQSIKNIYLTLKKIKLNETFFDLGNQFGMTESQVSKVFLNVVPLISSCLKALFYWPSSELIKARVPQSFRFGYDKVTSIIDCFEVQTQDPSEPMRHTVTCSNSKQCNTLKFLISSTPDGLITFVSKGYGGRMSDLEITKRSGFLDQIPINSWIMAERGFKGLAPLLRSKSCRLVRLPSVSAKQKSSKENMTESKRTANLRVHVERLIKRVSDFKILSPHSCIDLNLVKYVNLIVATVCGIINLESPIIENV